MFQCMWFQTDAYDIKSSWSEPFNPADILIGSAN